MITALFGQVVSGRVDRSDYFRHSMVLIIIGGNALIGAQGMLVSMGLHGGAGDLWAFVQSTFGAAGVAALWLVVLGFLAAVLSLMAKRARDVGLSGGLFVLLLLLVVRTLVGAGLTAFSIVLFVSAWLALQFVPSGWFARRRSPG